MEQQLADYEYARGLAALNAANPYPLWAALGFIAVVGGIALWIAWRHR